MAEFSRALRKTIRKSFPITRFTGLNDDDNESALRDTDLRTATNVMLYRTNLLGGRFGSHRDPFAAALNSGASITFMSDFFSQAGGSQRVIFIAGNQILEESPGAPSTATDRTGTATAPTPGDNNFFTGAFFKDALYLATGSGGIIRKLPDTGNAVNLSGWFADNRRAAYIHSQFGFLFASGFTDSSGNTATTTDNNPMVVKHCELQDDSLWPETNIVEKIGGLSSFGDEYVTGLFRHRDFFMIGTNQRIYPISYTGDIFQPFQVQRPLEVGLAHQNAVVSINGEFTFFMDPKGHIHTVREVAAAFGNIDSQQVSNKIRNYISDLNPARIVHTKAAWYEERSWVVWAVSKGANQATHNELIILDVSDFPLDEPDHRAAKWFQWNTDAATTFDFNSIAILRRDSDVGTASSDPSTTGKQFLHFGTTTGWVKRFTETISYDEDDAGTQQPINTEMQTKFFDFADPSIQKSIAEIEWSMEPASFDPGPLATVRYDYGLRDSATRQIDMSANAPETQPLVGTAKVGTAVVASMEDTTQTKDYFTGAGTFAAVRLTQQLSAEVRWKLQRMTPIVEMRGEVPETR